MQRLINNKRIDSLLHFTRAENLESIFQHGLVPRKKIDSGDVQGTINDFRRYDNCTDAVCLSIEFPNYKMFWSLRQENSSVDWVVIELESRVLYEYDCAFCIKNAGCTEMFTTPIEERKGKRAFLKLFEELPNGPTREEMGIGRCSYYPTNPQAEVLAFGIIDTKYISKVYFEDRIVRNRYKELIPRMVARTDDRYYSCRKDFKHW